ncbi:MAG: hypothetical protein JWM93_1354, partial [Frankiales bacterium]|nr:hypothetical protein [Frankiales bacterium]
IAGKDPEDSASDTAPATVPNYTTGLSTDALQGKRIAIITSTDPTYNAAVATVQAAGATTINIGTNPTSLTVPSTNPSVLTSEFRRDLNAYLARVTAKGGHAGQPTLNDVITYNSAHPEEGLKFGQGTLISSQAVDLTDPAQNAEYQAKVTSSKQNAQASINAALNLNDGDPSNDIDGILTTSGGTTGIGARAGYPQLTIPAGFSASSRNPVGISFQGTAYSEAKLLAMGYAFEQATQARTGPAVTNPSIERCADVAQPKPFAERSCMPSGEQIMASIGGAAPSLGFSLEKASATDVQTLMKTKKLTSVSLTKGYLARIAAVNNAGPAINAVRSLNPSALADAAASDRYRRTHATPRALEGLPILVKDNLDVAGLPTTGGSIALQNTVPKSDSTVVDKLRAAGAVILGKTNMTEFDNLMSTATTGSGATLASFMPAGYSSLGGYTLNPYDTDLIQGGGGPGAGTANTSIVGNGGSAGSASAAAAGLAAMTVGTETNGGIVFPSSANSVVGMRPTYGTVSRAGMLPVAKSQDTPGAIGRTVTDVATELQAIVGKDGDDAATSGAPASAPDYLTGLTTNALSGKRIGVTNSTNANYVAANAALAAAGATLVTITAPAPAATASVFPYEFKRDLNAYLSSSDISTDRKSLKGVISYNNANEDEALKFGQGQLAAAQATDTSSGSADTTAYAAAVTAGRTASQDAITAVLNNGTPADPTDDLAAIVLPQDSRTQDTTYTAGARAGFPQISVPAGYNLPTSPTTSTTHDPVAVTFLGAANADAALLGLAYAYEQQSQLRKAPSEINPATWRCSPDSAFPARSCAPGDYLTAVSETPQAPATPVTTPPVTTPPVTPPVVLPVPTIGNPTISRTTSFKVSPKTRQVAVRVKCGVSSGSRCKGTITIKSGAVVIASRTFSIPAGKTTTVRLKLSASAYRTLVTRKKLPVSIKVTTRGSDGRTRTSA